MPSPVRWKADPTTGIIGYDPNGTDTGGHSIVLVGYDHDKQTFRIKNSWGASWNGNGFADITYDLFLKTAADANYITKVKNPTMSAAGTGIWRGFWAVPNTNGGARNVAVVYHAYSVIGPTSVVPNAVQIFGQDGSVMSYPDFVSGDSETATFGVGADTFQLTMSSDGRSATYWDATTAVGSTWWRCNPSVPAAPSNLNPVTYPDAVNDPYVLPSCAAL